VIAFLTWVSHIDNANWPPRPILVSAATPQGIAFGAPAPTAASSDPIALGEALFRRTPPGCFSCHSTQPGVQVVGPSLAGIGTRAGEVLKSSAYAGSARSTDDYIRESILHPSAYVVPALGTQGTAGRNTVRGPGYERVDFSLIKRFPIDRSRVEFRWEVFNLFNRANFGTPDFNISNRTVGTITSADDGRNMQFGLRFIW